VSLGLGDIWVRRLANAMTPCMKFLRLATGMAEQLKRMLMSEFLALLHGSA
jgi:hypothetical protein